MAYEYAKQVPIDVSIQNQCTVYSSCLYLETQKKQKAPFSEEIKYFYNLSGNFHRKKKKKMEKENW